jgi:hypothetical protein
MAMHLEKVSISEIDCRRQTVRQCELWIAVATISNTPIIHNTYLNHVVSQQITHQTDRHNIAMHLEKVSISEIDCRRQTVRQCELWIAVATISNTPILHNTYLNHGVSQQITYHT